MQKMAYNFTAIGGGTEGQIRGIICIEIMIVAPYALFSLAPASFGTGQSLLPTLAGLLLRDRLHRLSNPDTPSRFEIMFPSGMKLAWDEYLQLLVEVLLRVPVCLALVS